MCCLGKEKKINHGGTENTEKKRVYRDLGNVYLFGVKISQISTYFLLRVLRASVVIFISKPKRTLWITLIF
jgi:hypothetical protein